MPPTDPPPSEIFLLECYFDGASGYLCEVWPRGEVTYTWSSGSGLTIMDPGPGQSPYQYVECPPMGGGVLHVTITSPYGLSTQGWKQLSCRNQQEY